MNYGMIVTCTTDPWSRCPAELRFQVCGALVATSWFEVYFIGFQFYVYMCVYVSVGACACGYSRRSEKGVWSPGTRATGYCELPDKGAGPQTPVRSKNSKCS